MSKATRENLGIVLGLYIGLGAPGLICGIMDAHFIYSSENRCSRPLSRGAYIYPFYRIGCWLGEVP